MLKIYTKRAFEFRNPKTGQTAQTAFMGFTTVEDWVSNDPMFIMGTKTGSISVIQNPEQQKVLENGGDPDTELAELRARGAELKISRASQMGKDKLKTAIAEAEAKHAGNTPPSSSGSETGTGAGNENGGDPDLLSDMDTDALRQFADSNGIDLSAVADDASADDLRAAIAAAKE